MIYQAKETRSGGPECVAKAIEQVNLICGRVSSEERLGVLLTLTQGKPATVFWPAFFRWWNICDDTWHWRNRLLRALRRHNADEPGTSYLSETNRQFLDGLPDPVRVFRGCSRRRARGVSWTTDREIAAGFAKGHRFISVPSPVIVAGLVPKRAVFGAIQDRQESELILDPAQVARLNRRL